MINWNTRYHTKRRLLQLFFVLIALLICGVVLKYIWTNQGDLEDVLTAEPRPMPGRSIFFLETSCQLQTENPQYKLLQLTARQACAIESAALHNLNFQVFVLFAGPTYRISNDGKRNNTKMQPVIEAILSYSNVHLRRMNPLSFAAGTPVEEWVQDGNLFRSSHLYWHIADLLRYLALYRYGGIYLDMDVVVLRSMEEMLPNYTAKENNNDVATGVMSMEATGIGHEIAELCLRDFQLNFNGHTYSNNGVITRVAQQICKSNGTKVMQADDLKRCQGFKVYGRNVFYAVPPYEWRDFFNPEKLQQTLARTKDSYVVHVWNKFSSTLKIKRNATESAYAKYAKEHCPRAYEASGEYF